MPDIVHTFAGIDPGASGAIAFVTGGCVSLHSCPVHKSGQVNHVALAELLRENDNTVFAMIEEVGARPGQGVCSMFSFGANYGAWMQGLACTGIQTRRIRPQEWKRAVGVTADKATSVKKAQQLFPLYARQFVGPKGGLLDGFAEAALLGWLAQRTWKLEGRA